MKAFVAIAITFWAAGCGCGDRVVARLLIATEMVAISADTARFEPFPIDASHVPPGTKLERHDETGVCGSPTTYIELPPTNGWKLVIVPTTKP